ncbi:hypothetical protein, partial [Escherichia coli]|uniref:hypothetical protein n=1 Tax=Escherichia coli TaxID=562 RepID=UPI0028DEA4C7
MKAAISVSRTLRRRSNIGAPSVVARGADAASGLAGYTGGVVTARSQALAEGEGLAHALEDAEDQRGEDG